MKNCLEKFVNVRSVSITPLSKFKEASTVWNELNLNRTRLRMFIENLTYAAKTSGDITDSLEELFGFNMLSVDGQRNYFRISHGRLIELSFLRDLLQDEQLRYRTLELALEIIIEVIEDLSDCGGELIVSEKNDWENTRKQLVTPWMTPRLLYEWLVSKPVIKDLMEKESYTVINGTNHTEIQLNDYDDFFELFKTHGKLRVVSINNSKAAAVLDSPVIKQIIIDGLTRFKDDLVTLLEASGENNNE